MDINEAQERFLKWQDESQEWQDIVKDFRGIIIDTGITNAINLGEVEDFLDDRLQQYYLPSENLIQADGRMRVNPKITSVWLEFDDEMYDVYRDSMFDLYWEGEYDDMYEDEYDFEDNEIVSLNIFDDSLNHYATPLLNNMKQIINKEFYEKSGL